MTDRCILRKDHLRPFLRRLAKEYRLVAPTSNRFGDTLFTEISAIDQAEIDLDNQAQMSIKPFLFPQQEVLFSYRADTCTYTPRNTSRPTVFFGLRSCDLAAILYMDVIFQSAQDPYYRKKRADSVLISIGCNAPFTNCFCLASRSGPFLDFGYDLQLTDLGDRYFVEAGRARGRELLEKWPVFFSPAARTDTDAQYQAYLESRGRFHLNVPMDQAISHLAAGNVPEDIYEELSGSCPDCGGRA